MAVRGLGLLAVALCCACNTSSDEAAQSASADSSEHGGQGSSDAGDSPAGVASAEGGQSGDDAEIGDSTRAEATTGDGKGNTTTNAQNDAAGNTPDESMEATASATVDAANDASGSGANADAAEEAPSASEQGSPRAGDDPGAPGLAAPTVDEPVPDMDSEPVAVLGDGPSETPRPALETAPPPPEVEFAELPAGSDTSIGSVEFVVEIADPERYCSPTTSSDAVLIEDEFGNLFTTYGSVDSCSQRKCSTCELNPACVIDDNRRFGFPGGGSTAWDGRRLRSSSCLDQDAMRQCLEWASYAPAGRYTAMVCISRGEPDTSGVAECRSLAQPRRECTRVSFDYPATAAVTLTLEPGGSDPGEWTVPCGGEACSVSRQFCDIYQTETLSVGTCEPIPEQCWEDLTCECLERTLPERRVCAKSALDDALRVAPPLVTSEADEPDVGGP